MNKFILFFIALVTTGAFALVTTQAFAYTQAQNQQISVFTSKLRNQVPQTDTYIVTGTGPNGAFSQIDSANNKEYARYVAPSTSTCCTYSCDLTKLFAGQATADISSYSSESPFPTTIYSICALDSSSCGSSCTK